MMRKETKKKKYLHFSTHTETAKMDGLDKLDQDHPDSSF